MKSVIRRFATVTFIHASLLCANAQETNLPSAFEYATIRWQGRDNTHAVMPDGNAQFFGDVFRGMKRPDRTDERCYYMNAAMNILGSHGFETVSTLPDEIVMKRRVGTMSSASLPQHRSVGMTLPRSQADARIQVTQLCQEGNQARLAYFEQRIEALSAANSNGKYATEIQELKRLQAGEIGLQRDLALFTKYVLAGKAYQGTTEGIQVCMQDSQERVAYFNRMVLRLDEQKSRNEITPESYQRDYERLDSLRQHDMFLQQVLTGYSQEQLARPRNVWEQAGNGTFERLLSFAVLAKLMQNPAPTQVHVQDPNAKIQYHPSR